MLHRHSWWRHQIETFSALLALCAGKSSVTGEFPSQRPVMQNYVFCDLCLNKRISKQSIRRWLETPSGSLWRHCNGVIIWQCQWNGPERYWKTRLVSKQSRTKRKRCSYFFRFHKLIYCGRDTMATILQTTFLNEFSWMSTVVFRFKFQWCVFLRIQLKIRQHWFR